MFHSLHALLDRFERLLDRLERLLGHEHHPKPCRLIGVWHNHKGVVTTMPIKIDPGQTLHGTIKDNLGGDPTGDVTFSFTGDPSGYTLTKTGPFTADITAPALAGNACAVTYVDGAGLQGGDSFSDGTAPATSLVGTWVP